MKRRLAVIGITLVAVLVLYVLSGDPVLIYLISRNRGAKSSRSVEAALKFYHPHRVVCDASPAIAKAELAYWNFCYGLISPPRVFESETSITIRKEEPR